MFKGRNTGYYIALLLFSGLFLIVHGKTHIEFFLHLAAIPIEVLVAVFIVEKFLENREQKFKRTQLMYIKSYMFRSEMRDLFVVNFEALKYPVVTMTKIKESSLEELKSIRAEAENLEYKSLEAMEPVIMEYAKARKVWNEFLERAITYNFEEIFRDMIHMLHFVHDIKMFKENNPEKLFVYEAAENEHLYKKVNRVLGDGIIKFLDYAIELKEKQPEIFEEVIADFEFTWRLRHKEQ